MVAMKQLDKPPLVTKFPSTTYKRIAVYTLAIILAMLISIIASVAITLHIISRGRSEETAKKQPIEIEHTTLSTEFKMITRAGWEGKQPLSSTVPLKHPTNYVLISHTAGHLCEDFERCSDIMRTIQTMHMINNRSPDIGYNFLIGGDGNVYIGRGWDVKNFHVDNNIGISFMGNYMYDTLTPKMISTLDGLLKEGVELKKLPANYKLVCHNQTMATLSPGINIYKEISKFPNFFPGYVHIE